MDDLQPGSDHFVGDPLRILQQNDTRMSIDTPVSSHREKEGGKCYNKRYAFDLWFVL